MARVHLTTNLRRCVDCPTCAAGGETVKQVLDAVFAAQPRVRDYVVDERGALRKHVVVFVDGTAVADRGGLSDPVGAQSEIYVMQALSGG